MNPGAVRLDGSQVKQIDRIWLRGASGAAIEAVWGWWKAADGSLERWARTVSAPTSAAFTLNRGNEPSAIDPNFRGALYGVSGYAGNYDVARKRISTGVVTNNNAIASTGQRTLYSWTSDGANESYELTVTARRTADPSLPAEFAAYQSGSGGSFTGSPVTVTDSRNQLVKMIIYFPGWASPRPEWLKVPGVLCPREYPWSVISTAHGPYYNLATDPDREPKQGYYDERSTSVIDTQIADMEAAGFEVAIYQVGMPWGNMVPELFGSGSDPGLPESEKPLYSHVARRHAALPQGEATGRLRFCLSWFEVMGSSNTNNNAYWTDRVNEGWTWATVQTAMSRFGDRIDEMVDSPFYYKIAGKPVFVIGSPEQHEALASRFSKTLAQFLAEFKTQTGRDWYYVVTQIPDSYHDTDELSAYGFDAQSEYRYRLSGYPAVRTEYTSRWNQYYNQTPAYFVPAVAAQEQRPWDDNTLIAVPTVAEFTAHLTDAAAFARAHHDKTAGHVIVYAWNEWGEGGVIEPYPAASGFMYYGDEMAVAAAGVT